MDTEDNHHFFQKGCLRNDTRDVWRVYPGVLGNAPQSLPARMFKNLSSLPPDQELNSQQTRYIYERYLGDNNPGVVDEGFAPVSIDAIDDFLSAVTSDDCPTASVLMEKLDLSSTQRRDVFGRIPVDILKRLSLSMVALLNVFCCPSLSGVDEWVGYESSVPRELVHETRYRLLVVKRRFRHRICQGDNVWPTGGVRFALLGGFNTPFWMRDGSPGCWSWKTQNVPDDLHTFPFILHHPDRFIPFSSRCDDDCTTCERYCHLTTCGKGAYEDHTTCVSLTS